MNLRPARLDDISRLVQLRALIMREMGEDAGDDQPWADAARAWYHRRMAEPATFRAFVVDDPDAGVVACAVGTVDDATPSPRSPSGVRGEVSTVVTEPAFRGRGWARSCVVAVLAWFDEETDVRSIRLASTTAASTLYRTLGFTEPRDEHLVRRRPE